METASPPSASNSIAPAGELEFALQGSKRASSIEARASERKLDQYYTQRDIAKWLYDVFQEHFDPSRYHMFEPSAGTGSFYDLLPPGSLGCDVDPKHPSIQTADFLTMQIRSDKDIAIIGNPPFGVQSELAVRFFNHAAIQASVIAFILPATFRKTSIQRRLNTSFHLMRQEDVPEYAFLFRSKPHNVPTVFQIWERRRELRELPHVETRHPDFEFTTPERATFAIQRIGARAGRIHDDLTVSRSSHYFIRGDVRNTMERLDLASAAGNVAAIPSLAKSEIVSLYREYIRQAELAYAGRL